MGLWMRILNPFQMSKLLRNKEMHIRKSILMVPQRYFNLDICSSTICHLIQKVIKWKKILKNTYILQAFCFPSQMPMSTTIFSQLCVVLDPCKGKKLGYILSFQFKFFLKRESCKSYLGPETAQISKGGGGGIWSQNATMNFGYKR